MELKMKNLNIMGVHWKIWFLEEGVHKKTIYSGEGLSKKEGLKTVFRFKGGGGGGAW